ncbi:Putative BTB/POZ domain-containing protein [Septoria linicola]|uniref:BTB/POZ domain-containing protein n=1 Tax=Septoria linicola TaxID=215465 RepID=A0A9Q9EQU1_9PEZI|nr:putative BTB/POZ domain-containing protein [Septoria linicola]USW59177.1 Putative BTB/POZ domain-containing protein [Septoria linicola]
MAHRTDLTVSKDVPHEIEAEMITLHIGTTKKAFHIRRKLLIKRSAYWKDRLSAADRTTKPMHLKDIKQEISDLYFRYIYTSQVPCSKTAKDAKAHLELVELYLMASKFKDFAAMDAAINAMLVVYSTGPVENSWGVIPCAESVATVYKSTPAASKLRKLFVDMYVWRENSNLLHAEDFGAQPSLAPFLLDLSRASLTQLNGKTKNTAVGYFGTSCWNYHEHARYVTCSTKKRKRVEDDGSVIIADLSDDESEGEESQSKKVKALEAQVKD